MDNACVQSRSDAQKTKRKAKPSAPKNSGPSRKETEVSKTKMDDDIPDLKHATLDEFMAAT